MTVARCSLGSLATCVLRLAQEVGVSVSVQQLTLHDLREADEAFFTGTAVEITPIASVDRRTIGLGTRGSITAKLQQAFLTQRPQTIPDSAAGFLGQKGKRVSFQIDTVLLKTGCAGFASSRRETAGVYL
jgi:hypothetical protein